MRTSFKKGSALKIMIYVHSKILYSYNINESQTFHFIIMSLQASLSLSLSVFIMPWKCGCTFLFNHEIYACKMNTLEQSTAPPVSHMAPSQAQPLFILQSL